MSTITLTNYDSQEVEELQRTEKMKRSEKVSKAANTIVGSGRATNSRGCLRTLGLKYISGRKGVPTSRFLKRRFPED